MNEVSDKVPIPEPANSDKAIVARVAEVANVQLVPASDPAGRTCRFAARTLSKGSLVLVTVGQGKITTNCEKMVIGNMLVKDIKKALQKV